MTASSSTVAAAPAKPRAIGWARLPVVVRRLIIAAVLVLVWHLYAVHKGQLLVATPWQTAKTFWEGWRHGTLAEPTWTTLRLLLEGIGIGAVVAAVLTAFATLSKVGEDLLILLTAVLNALPSAMAGLKTAWAFGWRTIIAAELVFGVAGSKGGLGNYINNARQYFLTPQMYAGLVTIAILGVVIETGFGLVERRTVVRWGMKTS
jgi:ABC-type nitrate/sulfonate/bicarbonate transport system permease component